MIGQNQRGFSIIELLISITLLSIITILTLPAIKQWTRIYKQTDEFAEIQQKYFLLFTEINKFLNIQSPLTRSIIHTQKLTSDILPSYMSASVKNNPQKTNSNAFSIQIPDTDNILNIENQIINSDTFFIQICLLKANFNELKKQNLWLLISIDGIIETQGTLTETGELCKDTNNKNASYHLAVKQVNKPIFNWSAKQLVQNIETQKPNIKFIMPVKESATLYIDTNDTLRRIDHNQGSSNPIGYNSYSWTAEILNENSKYKILKVQGIAQNEYETKFKNLVTQQIIAIPNNNDNSNYLDIFF